MIKALTEMAAKIAEIERRLATTMRHGTVAQVNPATGLVRLDLGEGTGGAPLLSPWIRYAQTGGALKVHSPPSVGQQMTLMAPDGDFEQGVAMPMAFSTANPSPSAAGDATVITIGAVTLTLMGDGLTAVVGGVTLSVTAAGVAITGGAVTHNGANIGSSHTHGGIATGPQDTGPPN